MIWWNLLDLFIQFYFISNRMLLSIQVSRCELNGYSYPKVLSRVLSQYVHIRAKRAENEAEKYLTIKRPAWYLMTLTFSITSGFIRFTIILEEVIYGSLNLIFIFSFNHNKNFKALGCNLRLEQNCTKVLVYIFQ